MARSKENFEHKKEEIIKVALKLFVEKSYENTTINNIMEASNVSKGGMYHYFASKEDILNDCLDYITKQDYIRFEEIIKNTSLTAIDKLLKVIIVGSEKPENIQKVVDYAQINLNSIFGYRIKKLSLELTSDCLEKIIQQGIQEGTFHTEYPKEMAEFCCYAGGFLYDNIFPQKTIEEYEKKLNAYLCVIEKCLGIEEGILSTSKKALISQFEAYV